VLPLGWIRQSTSDWQLAAFVAPLGHKTHQDSWYWETLGGVFARYMSSDRVAWIFGAYADVSPLEEFYTPYLGAILTIEDSNWQGAETRLDNTGFALLTINLRPPPAPTRQ
jgi:hypothetical protein